MQSRLQLLQQLSTTHNPTSWSDIEIQQLASLLKDVIPAPPIGIDLDGCIDEAPEWFQALSLVWPGPVYVITFRKDQQKAEHDVARLGVRCDEVILVDRFDAKAAVINERGVRVYFDDQDEMLFNVADDVTVLKLRNGGNFDFETRQWLFSQATGRMI